MNINALKLRVRAIKRRYINLFIVVFFILLFSPLSFASAGLIINFEDYATGYLKDNAFWTHDASCGATNYIFLDQDISLNKYAWYKKTTSFGCAYSGSVASFLPDSDVYFVSYDFYRMDTTSRIWFKLTQVDTNHMLYVSLSDAGVLTLVGDGGNLNIATGLAVGQWYTLVLKVDKLNGSYSGMLLGVHDEFSSSVYFKSDTATSRIHLSLVSSYIDNIIIDYEFPPVYTYDYDINIEITAPEVGSMTELPNGTTTTTGIWEVKKYSNLYWDNIHAVVKNLATLKSTLFSQAIDGTASSSGIFSIDIEDLEDGNYQLCWSATGTRIPYATRWVYFYCEEDEKTILRIGDFPELPRYILLEEFEACNFEDCAEYDLLEKLVCEIKNFGLSLICPDPEKLLDLKIAIDEIKNKFPINYIKLVRQEYNFLREEIEDKNDFEITIFGNTANVEVNFFDSIEDENGNTLMDYLKWFFNGLIILSFVLYGLYFMKRIF